MDDKMASTDEILPPGRLAALGAQHVLVMYAGAIAVPLIIAGIVHLSVRQTGYLISSDMF